MASVVAGPLLGEDASEVGPASLDVAVATSEAEPAEVTGGDSAEVDSAGVDSTGVDSVGLVVSAAEVTAAVVLTAEDEGCWLEVFLLSSPPAGSGVASMPHFLAAVVRPSP